MKYSHLAALFVMLVYGVPLLLLFFYARWGYRDAESRGKSGWLVVLLVLSAFPAGLLAWLVFRPNQRPEIPRNYLRQS